MAQTNRTPDRATYERHEHMRKAAYWLRKAEGDLRKAAKHFAALQCDAHEETANRMVGQLTQIERDVTTAKLDMHKLWDLPY